MIPVNELRLGNYFYPGSPDLTVNIPQTAIFLQVGSINKFGDVEVIEPHQKALRFRSKEIHPIPITIDILERCGFVDRSAAGLNNRLGFGLKIYESTELVWYVDDGYIRYQSTGSGFSMNFERRISQLHRLQNLYFSVTNKELTVNQPILRSSTSTKFG